MEDQVASLRKRGVNTAIVTSGGGVSNEFCAIDDDLGKYSHLFCAPEALISSRWREALVRVCSKYTTSHVQPCDHADVITTRAGPQRSSSGPAAGRSCASRTFSRRTGRSSTSTSRRTLATATMSTLASSRATGATKTMTYPRALTSLGSTTSSYGASRLACSLAAPSSPSLAMLIYAPPRGRAATGASGHGMEDA